VNLTLIELFEYFPVLILRLRMMSLFSLLIVAVVLCIVSGFQTSPGFNTRISSSLRMANYAEQLNRARSGQSPVQTGLQPSLNIPQDQNEGPFSDEMENHLAFVITKLSERIKSDEPMEPLEMNKFRNSVDAILIDMNLPAMPKYTDWDLRKAAKKVGSTEVTDPKPRYIPPSHLGKDAVNPANPNIDDQGRQTVRKSPNWEKVNPKTAAVSFHTPKAGERAGSQVNVGHLDLGPNDPYRSDPNAVVVYEMGEEPNRRPVDEADPDSPFAELHGYRSQWEIAGMEQMSVDEFYRQV
jgi:hypothetical protein